MKKVNFLTTLLRSILGGIIFCIGFIAVIFCSDKIDKAIVVAITLLLTLILEMPLSTLNFQEIVYKGKSARPFIMLLGNLIGILVIAVIASISSIGAVVQTYAIKYLSAKASLQVLPMVVSTFCSAILGGLTLSFAIYTVEKINNKVCAYSCALIPLFLFGLINFEHLLSVIAYVCFTPYFVLFGLAYMLVVLFGNVIGSIILPSFIQLIERINRVTPTKIIVTNEQITANTNKMLESPKISDGSDRVINLSSTINLGCNEQKNTDNIVTDKKENDENK